MTNTKLQSKVPPVIASETKWNVDALRAAERSPLGVPKDRVAISPKALLQQNATWYKLAILLCLLLLVACQPQKKLEESTQVPVKVAHVVSGQTLEVLGLGNQPSFISQVRLLGIDAPDLQQRPWGDAAKQYLEALVREPTVILEFDMQIKDQFGRTLAYAWKNGVLLNEQLVKEGYALFVGRSPNHKYDLRLERAQQWARLMEQGIWNPEKPMRLTPGEFRRQYR